MGRVSRWRMGGGVYHVINRGINSSWILEVEKDRDAFLKILAETKKAYKINIYHYVIMSSHFHLALEALSPQEMSAYIGNACALYSKHWHKGRGGRGTIWQGRYKSIVVQKEQYLNRLGKYIELNPARAGIITPPESPSEYKWSSAAAYTKGAEDPLVMPEAHPYRENWGKTKPKQQKNYAAYLLDNEQEALEIFRSKCQIIGDEDFKRKAFSVQGRLSVRKTGRPKEI